MSKTTVLLCRCATHKCLGQADVCALQNVLGDTEGVDLRMVDDLCALVEKQRSEQADLDDAEHVIACYPRAVKWLLNRDGGDNRDKAILNLREHSAEEILMNLEVPLPEERVDNDVESTGNGTPEWAPWFPVIDYDRCTHCGQCLSFCLFKVFEKDGNGNVVVAAPRNCKDECPACARICPEVAIMFPKTQDAPINGDEIEDELLEREKALIALQQSGGSDLHKFLRTRSKASGKRLLKPEARKKITGKDK